MFPEKHLDFLPAMAFLFPELVEGYQWWGHIASNIMMGQISDFVTPKMLKENDIISGNARQFAW
jgi:hypothetical protein